MDENGCPGIPRVSTMNVADVMYEMKNGKDFISW